MKALVLDGIKKMHIEERSIPVAGTGEVLLKIKSCGICSSDLDRVFRSGAYHYPIVLGHEFSGEVVSVGDGVDSSWIGKAAAVFPLLPCKKCQPCCEGKFAQCKSYNYFGSRCDGAYAEYLAVPEWNLLAVPANVPVKYASLCEPASVAAHALSKIDSEKSILIIGTGTIGIILGLFAKLQGKSVAFISRNSEKTAFLHSLGFENVFGIEFAGEYDAVFECVGTEQSLNDAILKTKPFGKLVLVGNPKGDMLLSKINYWRVLRQEIKVEGIWNSVYQRDWQWSLEHFEFLPLDKLVTHYFALSDGLAAFKELDSKNGFKLKGMFIFE